MDFTIKTGISIVFIILFIPVSVFLAWFFYKKVSAELNKFYRYFLPALRSVSIFLILILFASPIISSINLIREKPRNVILIDNSESLIIEDRYKESLDVLNRISKLSTGNNINDYYLFSGDLKQRIENIPNDSSTFYSGDIFSTDIGLSTTQIFETSELQNIASVLILSDGINTKGGSSSYFLSGFDVPIGFVLSGDTIQKKDVSITNVNFNPSAFIESKTPVNVKIFSSGYEGNLEVSLFENESLLDRQIVSATLGITNYETTFNVTTPNPGFKSYTVKVQEFDDEITYRNNAESFFIKFIDNKFRVLVIAGAPSSDLAFIKQEINRISNFETQYLTQKGRGVFYEELPDLNLFNSIILVGYPNSFTYDVFLNDIYQSIKRNEQSVFFFSSSNIDMTKLSIIDGVLPFIAGGSGASEIEATLQNVSQDNSVFTNSEFLNIIDGLPQIFVNTAMFSPKPGSKTLLINNQNRQAAFIVNQNTEPSSAAFLAHGFYKWRLNPGDSRRGEEALSQLLSNTLLAITDKEKQKKIKVETDFQDYSPLHRINIKATTNPTGMEFSPRVNYRIKENDVDLTGEMLSSGYNSYSANQTLESSGNYFIIAELSDNTGLIDSDTSMIKVGQSINEFRFTKAENSLLNNISTATNGSQLTTDEDLSIFLSREVSSQKIILSNIALNFNVWLLSFIILILCIEWFFRKRNNLP